MEIGTRTGGPGGVSAPTSGAGRRADREEIRAHFDPGANVRRLQALTSPTGLAITDGTNVHPRISDEMLSAVRAPVIECDG